jgi:hypothetical protein
MKQNEPPLDAALPYIKMKLALILCGVTGASEDEIKETCQQMRLLMASSGAAPMTDAALIKMAHKITLAE